MNCNAQARRLLGAMTECRPWSGATTQKSRFRLPINGSRWIWRTSACARIKERESSSTAPLAQDAREKTPAGEFRAGPVKSRMHRSRLYHNAPMPWSVQVHENIFIHGFRKVPRRPSSHGCIRLPLTGANPAKWFYNWIDLGTPISIKGHWPAASGGGVEESVRPAHPFLPKVVIAIVITIVCFVIILFVSRRGRKL